jgi:hypothetical protein
MITCSCSHQHVGSQAKEAGVIIKTDQDLRIVVIKPNPKHSFQIGEELTVFRSGMSIGYVQVTKQLKAKLWVADIMKTWESPAEKGDVVLRRNQNK